MRVGSGDSTYEWVEHWAKIPDTESARSGWAHHGVAISESGHAIAGGNHGDPRADGPQLVYP